MRDASPRITTHSRNTCFPSAERFALSCAAGGPGAEADAARRLPHESTRCGRRAADRPRELTRRFSAGPKPGRISFYAELGGATRARF